MEQLEGRIQSLQVGKPQRYDSDGQEWTSAISKASVQGRLKLSRTQLQGDEQADLIHHGGPNKAVCVYCDAHFSYWENKLGRTMGAASFGENVTMQGLTEDIVCIGDIYRVGDALVEVSQPRQPCYKLAKRYGVPELPLYVQESGFTGYYWRVLEEGAIGQGDTVTLVRRGLCGITIEEANRVMYHKKQDAHAIRSLLNEAALSNSWRETLTKRLEGLSS